MLRSSEATKEVQFLPLHGFISVYILRASCGLGAILGIQWGAGGHSPCPGGAPCLLRVAHVNRQLQQNVISVLPACGPSTPLAESKQFLSERPLLFFLYGQTLHLANHRQAIRTC